MTERVYGVTPPISTTLPNDDEKRANDALARELRAQGTFEAPTETMKREHVLKSLSKITDEFVKRAAQEKEPKNTFLIRNARGRVFTYGSYRLGVFGPGSDMDTLIVAPRYVTVEQYFKIFPDLLVEMAPPGAITDLNPVPDAFVPIIKFEYSNISIDLIFCSIQTLKQLPDERDWNLQDNSLLRGLSENEVRSLNGTRVTDEILNLVPEPATFKLAIRAIKLWAQRKAIYANVLGYPGGVAWAMMVARVCQLYPKATSALIVTKFFNIMLKWPWPLPVLLKDIEYGLAVTRVPVWNPKIYPSDRNHRMPIITPSYPSMCATHNVGHSSMITIQQELEVGVRVSEEIMKGKRPWKDLFTKHSFFTAGFKFYLTIVSSAETKEAQKKWSSFIESRVRMLVQKLDMHQTIALARPFNKGFDRVHRYRTEAEKGEIQNGSVAFQIKPEDLAKEKADQDSKADIKPEIKPDVKTEIKDELKTEIKAENGGTLVKTEQMDGLETTNSAPFKGEENGDDKVKLEDIPEHKVAVPTPTPTATATEIYTTSHYIGLQLAGQSKSLDLSREVNEFKAMCIAHDIYEPTLMCIAVQHVRSWDLPDDVFEPGEVKPTRPVKKKRLASEEPNRPTAKRQQTATAAG